jgi:hypothetical protein
MLYHRSSIIDRIASRRNETAHDSAKLQTWRSEPYLVQRPLGLLLRPCFDGAKGEGLTREFAQRVSLSKSFVRLPSAMSANARTRKCLSQ